MSYLNREELKKQIGNVGIFYNSDDDKSITIGRLISVTENGNCRDEDDTYFDEFVTKSRSEMMELIDLEYYS